MSAVLRSLPALARPPGRPAAPPVPEAPQADLTAISRAVLEHLIAHPGCVTGNRRRRYSDGYRHLVLDLRERFAAVPAPAFSTATAVPEGTLADWIRAAKEPLPGADERATSTESADDEAAHPRIQAILAAWKSWQGPFTKFCQYVNHELRIPVGRTFISSILSLRGLRKPRRRPGRSPDEDRDAQELPDLLSRRPVGR